jgi:hypothetical protein
MSAISANARPLPKSMSYYVSRVSGFRRVTTRLLPQGSTSVVPSSTVRIVLPSNSLVDLETFGLFCDFTIPANNIAPANIDTALIRSMTVEVGGVQISNISDYNQLLQVLWSWTAGQDARNRRAINQFGNTANNNAGTYKIAMQTLLPIDTMKPTLIDTGLTGDIVITLNMASRFILGSTTANRADWSIANLYASIDVISFADGGYSMMLRNAVASGEAVLEIPFMDAQGYSQAVASGGQSTRFVTVSPSVDMLVATLVPSNFDSDTNNDSVYSTDLTQYFRKYGDYITDYQFTVNGSAIPAFPVLKNYTPSYNAVYLGQAQDLLGGNSVTTSNVPGTRITDLNQHFAAFLKLNASLSGEDAGRYLSGLDTRGTNAQFEFKTTVGGAGAATVLVWVLSTRVLRVGANRQIELV